MLYVFADPAYNKHNRKNSNKTRTCYTLSMCDVMYLAYFAVLVLVKDFERRPQVVLLRLTDLQVLG